MFVFCAVMAYTAILSKTIIEDTRHRSTVDNKSNK